MSKKGDDKKKEDDKDIISDRHIRYIDDPKDSSALAKIHELSNKAKRPGKSPTQNHLRFMRVDDDDEPINGGKLNFNRRSSHFATVKNPDFIQFGKKQKEPDKNVTKKGMRNSVANIYNFTSGKSKYKTEYVWDKNINRLVEKKIPIEKKESEAIKEDKEKEEILKFDD